MDSIILEDGISINLVIGNFDIDFGSLKNTENDIS